MNQNPRAAAGIVFCLIAIAVTTVVIQVLAGRRSYSELPDGYFSDDGGKTFFPAASTNVPPFDHGGKEAVRAYVFECKSGERFVGYVEKFNPEAHKLMLAGKGSVQTQVAGRLLKRPADASWVKSNDQAAVAKVVDVRCPGGGEATPVEP